MISLQNHFSSCSRVPKLRVWFWFWHICSELWGFLNTSWNFCVTALLCQIAALKSFANDKLQYWRERASGMSSLAHFMAKDTVDHFNTLVKPAVYLSMFYFFTNPRSTFLDNYIVLVCLVYCVTGMGYAFAILLRPESSQLVSWNPTSPPPPKLPHVLSYLRQ